MIWTAPRRADRHPYELFLQLEEIEHRTSKVKRSQSNGFVERLRRRPDLALGERAEGVADRDLFVVQREVHAYEASSRRRAVSCSSNANVSGSTATP